MKIKKITKKDIESFKKVLEFSFYNKNDIGKMLCYSDEPEKTQLERIINTIEAYAKLHRDDGYNEAKEKYEDILFGDSRKKIKKIPKSKKIFFLEILGKKLKRYLNLRR